MKSLSVAIDPPDERFDESFDEIVAGSTLLKYCSSLIKFSAKTQVVQLSHFSVREYLTKERFTSGGKNVYFLEEDVGNREIMEVCLACLSFPNFDELLVGADSTADTDTTDEKPPSGEELRSMKLVTELRFQPGALRSCRNRILEYATLNWPLHGRVVEAKSCDEISVFLSGKDDDIRDKWMIRFFELQMSCAYIPLVRYIHSTYFLAWFGFVTLLRDAIAHHPNDEYTAAVLGRALLAAAFAGESEAARVLVEAKANVGTVDLRGETALHFASREGHAAIVEILLQSGANINSKCTDGFTPLHVAAMSGNTDCLRLLLNGGVDVDAQNNSGDTALGYAVQRDNLAVVKLLLDNNADISVPGNQLNTAMHQAARAGSAEVVKMLLDSGYRTYSTRGRCTWRWITIRKKLF